MARKNGTITIEKLALIFADAKYEGSNPVTGFTRLWKGREVGDPKSFAARFLEYLVFDLFTDRACFLLAFGLELTDRLFEIYCANMWHRLLAKTGKFDWQDFELLFTKRATEYHQYLQQFDPEYVKRIDMNKYPHGLGKAFSKNLVGYEDPTIFFQADHIFVSKLSTMVKYFKEVAEKSEIVMPK